MQRQVDEYVHEAFETGFAIGSGTKTGDEGEGDVLLDVVGKTVEDVPGSWNVGAMGGVDSYFTWTPFFFFGLLKMTEILDWLF